MPFSEAAFASWMSPHPLHYLEFHFFSCFANLHSLRVMGWCQLAAEWLPWAFQAWAWPPPRVGLHTCSRWSPLDCRSLRCQRSWQCHTWTDPYYDTSLHWVSSGLSPNLSERFMLKEITNLTHWFFDDVVVIWHLLGVNCLMERPRVLLLVKLLQDVLALLLKGFLFSLSNNSWHYNSCGTYLTCS